MRTVNYFENNAAADATATAETVSTFAEKLKAQMLKQTSKTEVLDQKVVIRSVGPVISKEGEVQENRLRIVDNNGVIHWCFKNQIAGNKAERLAAGMPVVISYRQKGEYINVLSVTPELDKLNAQQLAYLSGNAIVIPAL